jgi:hypothetical protein
MMYALHCTDMLQCLVGIALKLLRSRSAELLAPHDSASATGSGLKATMSGPGADCGAKSRTGMRRYSVGRVSVCGALLSGLGSRVRHRDIGALCDRVRQGRRSASR